MNKKIGVLGGGQLGRMLAEAASPLDLNIRFMDTSIGCPVGQIWSHFKEGDITNFDDVIQFGNGLDVITIEIEGVNEDALKELEKRGKEVYPQPHILSLIKDKGLQKQFYKDHKIATSDFLLYENKKEVIIAIEMGAIVIPFVQKARKGGYDGRGVHLVKNQEDIGELLDCPCLVEDLVDISKEIGVVVCRGLDGTIKSFPTVEMDFHPTANLVEFLFCPSKLSEEKEKEALKLAELLADKLKIVGLLAVELFEDTNGNILINEVAPRPHNSGHHTIEACITSQYQQHLRAIAGLPLGDTSLIKSAVMVNLLGEKGFVGPARYQGIEEVMRIAGVYPHIYGKKITKPFRKMGHVTITDNDLDSAFEKAKKVKATLKVISE